MPRILLTRSLTRSICFILAVLLGLGAQLRPALAAEGGKTITVSAEGLADPNADAYKRDKALMVEDLRRDAKAQVIEKAVGSFVETSTLIENYALIRDRVMTRSQGLIKSVIKESPPWIGDDGFAHMLIKAEVYISDVRNALKEMSKGEKRSIIKEFGDPKISVAIFVQDAERDTGTRPQRSDIAENILKERIKGFGYRVWSEDYTTKLKTEMMVKSSMENQVDATISVQQSKAADFFIEGSAKFKKVSQTLQPANITVTKVVLTSWSVKCVDSHTGEEILYNNQVPRGKAWPSEDQAIEDIGKLIGEEFSKDFFTEHLQAPSKIFQLQVLGLPNYDVGQLMKKEFIGLRPVLNVDFRDFDKSGASLYEVEFAGSPENFNSLLNSTVIGPLNQKLGEQAFSLDSARGNMIRVTYRSSKSAEAVTKQLNTAPPASFASASPERLKEVIKSEETLKKVAAIAPEAAKKIEGSILGAEGSKGAVQNF